MVRPFNPLAGARPQVFHPQRRCTGAVDIKRLLGIEAGCEKGPTEAQNRAVAFANRAERLSAKRSIPPQWELIVAHYGTFVAVHACKS
jgi:hypothetical protein